MRKEITTLHYHDIAQNTTRLRALTSLMPNAFVTLLPAFEATFLERMRDYTLVGLPRRSRRYTAYKHSPLPTIEDKLLFMLVHVKQNLNPRSPRPSLRHDSVRCEHVVDALTTGARRGVATTGRTPSTACRYHGASCGAATSGYSRFYHDGTERPIQRPLDQDDQEEYYSGKQKCHTVKYVLLINMDCFIRFLSATYAGKWHDNVLVDDESYPLPPGSVFYQD